MKKIVVFILFMFILVSCWADNKDVISSKWENNKKEEINIEKKKENPEKNLIIPKRSYEEKIFFESYSSFDSKEMNKKVEKMKDSPEKLRVLNELLRFEDVRKLNSRLVSISKKEDIKKAKFILKDMDWNAIPDAKVKNLITWETIKTDYLWKWIFKDDFIHNLGVSDNNQWYTWPTFWKGVLLNIQQF